MSYSQPARTTHRPIRLPGFLVTGVIFVIAAIVATLGYEAPASSSSKPSSLTHGPRIEHHGPPSVPSGEAEGAVPDGTTVFDDAVPGVANLDPALLDALRQAATAASSDGVQFVVDSGWRSVAYQEHLLQNAIAQYGSEAEAARWVATPETSPHVSGDAIDMGSTAAAWLSANGAAYGLCQIYGNEPWHYELRPDAVDQGCPAMYADPTQDPRLQS